ncbi:MAG TPA: hypothetical protein VGJ81_09825 [Thermoanaerobaculia bacterium]
MTLIFENALKGIRDRFEMILDPLKDASIPFTAALAHPPANPILVMHVGTVATVATVEGESR